MKRVTYADDVVRLTFESTDRKPAQTTSPLLTSEFV